MARELNGKRKRERLADEDEKATKMEEEEKMCLSGGKENSTPVRKVRGQTKSSQRLFACGADVSNKEAGEERNISCSHSLL